jgi:hypothetical protein
VTDRGGATETVGHEQELVVHIRTGILALVHNGPVGTGVERLAVNG